MELLLKITVLVVAVGVGVEGDMCSTGNPLSDLKRLLQVPTAVFVNTSSSSSSSNHKGSSGHPQRRTTPPSNASGAGCDNSHLYVWIDPLCPDGRRVWDEAKTLELMGGVSLSFHLFPLPFHTLSYEVLRVFHRLPLHDEDSDERRRHFIDAVLKNLGQFSSQSLNHRKLRDVYFDLLQLDEHGGHLQPMEAGDALARKHAKAASALGIFASPQFLFSPTGCGNATDITSAFRLPSSVASIRDAQQQLPAPLLQ